MSNDQDVLDLVTPSVDKCRCCGSASSEPLGDLPNSREFAGYQLDQTISGGTLYRCASCDFVYRSPILSAEEYGRLYQRAPKGVWSVGPCSRRNDQRLARRYIEENFSEGGAILDVGCYAGDFLRSLSTKYQKFGIEMCTTAAEQARESGITIIGNDLYVTNKITRRFDVIVAMDVVEHVVNPKEFLKSLLALTTDNGALLITTGDARAELWLKERSEFWYCAFPEHISFISERWLMLNFTTAASQVQTVENFRYEKRPFWLQLAMGMLIGGSKVLGTRPHPIWRAHKTRDHLFAVIRRGAAALPTNSTTDLGAGSRPPKLHGAI